MEGTNKLLIASLVALFMGYFAQAQLPYLIEEEGEVVVDKKLYNEYINSHPFSTRKPLLKEDLKKMDKKDRPDLAYEHDWLMTQDPKTGKIEWDRLIPVISQLNSSGPALTVAPGGSVSNSWSERGPNNIGGRVRAIMFDPTDNTNKKVWAGGVGGGLWYNTDITSSSTSWIAVNDFWANLAVSSMAYDPNTTSTWYVGTGEGFGNADNIRGAGIWKTTNSGTTWTQLTSTSPGTTTQFRYVNDLVVTSTGRVVAACSGGLYTSDNGGTSWTRRQSSSYFADIEIAANGDIYAGTRYSGRLYKSTNNGTNWTQLTNLGGNPDRIEIACAPSDSNTIYIVASGGSGSTDVEIFKKSVNAGTSWTNVTIPLYASNSSNHFTRGQAWYDLILWVHPTNANMVVAGGVDLHRTTNGGTSWSPVSYWNTSQWPLPEVHADIHAIISRPGNNNEVLIGNDGGVYYSTNLGNSSVSAPTFSHRVKNFNVTQFYSAAMHPSSTSNVLVAGAQDNGTIQVNSTGIGGGTELTGGDGAFCFIDQNNSSTFITSYVYNNWRRSNNSGNNFNYLPTDNSGRFINPADYDDNLNILYAARTSTTLKRITNMTGTYSIGNITVSGMNVIATHVRVSPYTTSSSTLFVGSGGDVFKVSNANGTPSTSKITPSSFPSGTISCVEIGASENELLVTFSNYGVNSVWYTSNGGTSWVSKEGNLPDMPVRWAMFNPKNRSEVILATEVGVWSTDDISATSVVWTASNQGLANTRVDMLQYRSSDSLIMASTHGRGIFTGRFKAPITNGPVSSFTSNKDTICIGDTVTFTSTSTNNPTTHSWTIPGGNPSSGTQSTVSTTYSTSGHKTVSLKVTNSFGSDSTAKVAVYVEANPSVSLGAIGPYCVGDPAQLLTQGSPSGGVYSGPGVSGGMFNPGTAGVGSHTVTYTYTSNAGCVGSANTTVSVTSTPNVSASSVPNQCENGSTLTLTNGSPSGGTYKGPGVSSGTFNPGTAGTGAHILTYTFGSNSCKDSATFTIVVDSAPNVNLTSFGPFCTSDPMITLTQGSPSGGVYSGPGVSGNTFSPSVAGAGTHTISYKLSYSNGCSDSASVSVVVSAGFNASAGTVPNQCENGPAITLSNGTPTGGVYQGPGMTGNVFNPSMAGSGIHNMSYILGSGSCADTAKFTIQVDSAPQVTLSSIGPFCSSDSAQTLTQGSPSGGTYSGTGVVAGKFDPSVSGIGSHTVKYIVTNSSGCTDSASTVVQVTSGSPPSLGTFSDVCEGSASITLTGGSPTGGTYSGPGVSGGSFDPVVAGVGVHTISYSHSSSCGTAATSTLTVLANPKVVASSDTAICLGTSAQLSVTGASIYTWRPAASLSSATSATPIATPGVLTIYIVDGVDAAGCTGSDSVSVAVNALPTVSAGNDDSTCAGDPIKLQATGAVNYVWFPSTGLSSTTVASPTATITGDMLYEVEGTDANGCIDRDSVLIKAIQTPPVTIDPIADACLSGASVTLTGSPSGGKYTGAGVTNGVFDPGAAGLGTHSIIYEVTFSKCTSADTTTVTVTSSPAISWTSALAFCENDSSSTPSATPAGGTFSGSAINNGIIDPMTLGAGTFEITYNYSDSGGCAAQDTKEVTIYPAYVDSIQGVLNAIINRTYNYHVTAINGSSYTWKITGGSLLSTNSNTITVKWGGGPRGTIHVIQMNQFGCIDSTSESILVSPLSDEEFSLDGTLIKVYPNPASSTLQIRIKGNEGMVSYKLVDMQGKQVLSGEIEVQADKSVHEVDVTPYPSGLYFIVFDREDQQETIPLVIGQ